MEMEAGGIEDDVFDPLALPSVGDVDEAVAGLDDSGVGIFARLVFEDEGSLPGFTVD